MLGVIQGFKNGSDQGAACRQWLLLSNCINPMAYTIIQEGFVETQQFIVVKRGPGASGITIMTR